MPSLPYTTTPGRQDTLWTVLVVKPAGQRLGKAFPGALLGNRVGSYLPQVQ